MNFVMIAFVVNLLKDAKQFCLVGSQKQASFHMLI